jgi:hypothetical protein
MSRRRARCLVSDAAETVISFATNATNSVPHNKILLLRSFAALLFLGAFAAVLVVVGGPILSRADMPPVSANSILRCYDSAGKYQPCAMRLSRTDTSPMQVNGILKCYDSAGKYQPCVTRASASQSRFNGRTTGTEQLASWTTTALYQVDQPANWTTSTPVVRQGSASGRPRESSTSGRPRAFAICRRRLIPCFLSTLRRGLTHIASAAAIVGQARPAREHL